MGFFGGEDDGQNELMNQQLMQQEAEIEAKRQALVQEKINAIRGMGGEVWSPDRTASAVNPTAKDAGKPYQPDLEIFRRMARRR